MSKSRIVRDFFGEKLASGGKAILESNAPFISNLFGGAELIENILSKESKGFGEAIAKTFSKGGETILDEAGKTVAKNGYDVGKIAASYLGTAAVGRAIGGGGLYKDRNGNTNIVGIPFI